MEAAAKLLPYVQLIALCSLLAIGFNATLYAVAHKHNLFEWYDTYRRRWMPRRTCELCTGFWATVAYTWPGAIVLSIALHSAGLLSLLVVPFVVAGFTLKVSRK